jgi:RNA polymerase sigma-70 factor (ECF subfamily)
LFTIAYKILKDTEYAEDAVQQTFLKIIESFDKIDFISPQKTANLLIVILKNISFNTYKLHIAGKELQNDSSISANDFCDDVNAQNNAISAENAAIMSASVENIIQCIDSLNEKYANVLHMRFINEASFIEISNKLSMTEGAVRTRFHRGRLLLVAALTREGIVEP